MFWTALLIGLAGGLHCAGMCGPLVMAVTARNPFIGNKAIYNAGRIITYGILGLAIGGIGEIISLTRYQNLFAYLSGGLLLLLGFGAINGIKIPWLTPLVYRFTATVKQKFSGFLQAKKSVFFLGMLNGILPCGLTYLALTYSLTLGSALDAALFMLIFGLGTVPVMVGLFWMIGILLKRVKLSYRKVSMMVMIVLGSLLIGRAFFSHSPVIDHDQNGVSMEVICR